MSVQGGISVCKQCKNMHSFGEGSCQESGTLTKKSKARLDRDLKGVPRKKNIAHVELDYDRKQIEFLTNDILLNQLQREGPKAARSFDKVAKVSLIESSKLFASSLGALKKHLPRIEDDGSKATCARLLFSAMQSYTAGLQVARHGFPSDYAILARTVIETLATVLALATNPEALEQFHSGRLKSSKCVTWSKKTFPALSPLWVELSNDFVHIGKRHSLLEFPRKYSDEDERIKFVEMSMLSIAFLISVVTELVYADESFSNKYWKRVEDGWTFEPSSDVIDWMKKHIPRVQQFDRSPSRFNLETALVSRVWKSSARGGHSHSIVPGGFEVMS